MLSTKFSRPLRLEPRPSSILKILCLLMAAITCLVVACLPMALTLKLPLWLLIPGLLLRSWQTRAELGGAGVILHRDADGQWFWQQRGEALPVRLCADSFVSLPIILLNFKETDTSRSYSLVLLHDSLPHDELRQLRVYLRMGPTAHQNKKTLM